MSSLSNNYDIFFYDGKGKKKLVIPDPMFCFLIWKYPLGVLPRNQICCDKWPTELEKVGPFQKTWGPSEFPMYDAKGLSAFRQVEKT